MQILFLSPHCDPEAKLGEPDAGGQCVYEHELARALSQLPETSIITFCRKNQPDKTDSLVSDTYVIRRIVVAGENFIPKENIEATLPGFVHQVRQLFDPNQPTVIHAHYWDGGKSALHLKATLQQTMPLVFTPHSLGAIKRKKFPGRRYENEYNFIPRLAWENYTLFASDHVIVSSDQEKEDVVSEYNAPPSSVSVISPGINFANFTAVDQKQARKRFKLPSKGKILLCLGRMSRAKSYEHAIRAFKVLQSKYQQPNYLVICGGSPNFGEETEEYQYQQALRNLAHDLEIENQVIFHPALPHDQVRLMYSAADIKLISADREPFGLTVLEAMATKTPVISANRGGPASIITHNQTGILVNMRNPEAVANYILSLLKDEELHQEISENAYQYVRSEYSWESKAKEFHQIYQEVLANPRNSFKKWVESNYFLEHNLM